MFASLHKYVYLQSNFTDYNAGVVELVDTLDLGSSAARCVGSSPSARTELFGIEELFFCDKCQELRELVIARRAGGPGATRPVR